MEILRMPTSYLPSNSVRDGQYLYHMTSGSTVRFIADKGLRSSLLRMGMANASPSGAFEIDRKNNIEGKIQLKLHGYLLKLRSLDITAETISNTLGLYQLFTIATTGDNTDHITLDNIEKSRLEEYCRLCGKQLVDTASQRSRLFKLRNDPSIRQLANSMIAAKKTHYLSRLATQVAAFKHRIEETITASHVYFFKPDDADTCYNDYSKNFTTGFVILRAKYADLTGLVADEAEGRAVRTRDAVQVDKLEILIDRNNPAQFKQLDFRCNAANWRKLADSLDRLEMRSPNYVGTTVGHSDRR
jgi:hypothetical protein